MCHSLAGGTLYRHNSPQCGFDFVCGVNASQGGADAIRLAMDLLVLRLAMVNVNSCPCLCAAAQISRHGFEFVFQMLSFELVGTNSSIGNLLNHSK